jgi:hypothetical protein
VEGATSPAQGEGEEPQPYDAEWHRAAEHIQWQKQGVWTVLWGDYTRRFWAYARWPVPEGGVVVSAEDTDELYAAMREAERHHGYLEWRHGRPAPNGPPSAIPHPHPLGGDPESL